MLYRKMEKDVRLAKRTNTHYSGKGVHYLLAKKTSALRTHVPGFDSYVTVDPSFRG